MNNQEKNGIYIAPGAFVIGDVTLGENVGIWYNAVVRGDTNSITIGNNTNIQDNSTLHTDKDFTLRIGNSVTIGHNAVVHGCAIGDNTVIGMGSIILSGAIIGRNCIVGAGSLVTGKMNIPDGSLVMGSPARIVRPLTETEIASNHENAIHYVALIKQQTT